MPFIRCPTCNARYKVGVEAGGKSAKCQKCGQGFKIPALKPPEPPGDEARLTDLSALAGGEAIELERPPQPATVPVATGPMAEAVPVSDALAYAPGMTGEETALARGAYGAYFRSLGRSLAFPVRGGDLITFGIVWVIVVAGELVRHAGACLGLIGWLIVTGWYMSFQLNVVLGAANGEEDLPTLTLTEGFWDDVVMPFFKMLVTRIVIYLPAGVFVALMAGANWSASVTGSGPLALVQGLGVDGVVVAGLLLLGGHFLWPMLILIVAVGSMAGLVRLDLIVRTVARSFPAYLLTVLAVYVSIGLAFGASILWGLRQASTPGGTASTLVWALPLKIVELYCTVIAMRAIGLYYHHFKHKFAWSWG